MRTTSEPARPTSLTDGLVLVLEVSYLANRCGAVLVNLTQLTGRKTQKDKLALLRHDLSVRPGRPAELSALSNLHLDVVYPRTERDRCEPHGVARLDLGLVARDDGRTDLKAEWPEDVALLTVNVVDKSNTSAAVRIVLDRGDTTGNAGLVTLEVDDAVPLLVTTTTVT